MKYVVLHHPDKLPVIALGLLVTHPELAAPYQARGYRATSAGFVRPLGDGRFETFGFSTGLQLTPHVNDARLIEAMYAATLKTAPACDPLSAEPCAVSLDSHPSALNSNA